jgi:hypothetical protein
VKTQEQKMKEIIDLLGELFQDCSIGLYPVANRNGADHYRCPGCSASKDTLGYASGQDPLSSVEHDDRCDLNLLYKMYREFVDEQEESDEDNEAE